jgi:hypothetical protein
MATLTLKNNRGATITINRQGDIRINGDFTFNGTQLEALEQAGFTLEEDMPTNNIGTGNIASNNGGPTKPKKKLTPKANLVINGMLRRKMVSNK